MSNGIGILLGIAFSLVIKSLSVNRNSLINERE
jgi:hypothetical protein